MKLKTLVVVATLLSAQAPAIRGFAAANDQRDPGTADNVATPRPAQVPTFHVLAKDDAPRDLGAGEDMKRLQGCWELRHGNEGKGAPTLRSVKTIVGNRETLRRFSIASGEMLSERTVEFELNQSGPVRVFTFYPIGGEAKSGLSYIYKVENNEFYDITGLLHGTQYRDYSEAPSIWRWTRVIERAAEGATNPPTVKPSYAADPEKATLAPDTRKAAARDQNANVAAIIKDVFLTDVDEERGVISVTFGRKDEPTQLVNVPLAVGVRLVASHVIPTVSNHLPFEWQNLKRLKGKVVSIRVRTSERGISVVSICERND